MEMRLNAFIAQIEKEIYNDYLDMGRAKYGTGLRRTEELMKRFDAPRNFINASIKKGKENSLTIQSL